ncbi:MAG: damage-inducible protein CinA [Clostridiales bacterium]|uniref:Damage-inducible protein CinA n=1 Tax=Candidatus Anaerobutyricum stercoripullorum TaxID=2838456 RepID=A0A9D2BFJ9_9FIRM|nr:damage-inducible protein CinA [Clostridiales bacterium]HIX73424.1 damage-inducible protein CinA [Candidatus Anaerobutyricum stercoripullorum]
MVAEIISVGTELLLGNIVNTNAQYIAKEMAKMGIDLYYQSVVGDNEERLSNVLKTALERSDLIITTGGLGPTKDDLTKEVAASYFGKQLVFDKKTYEHVKQRLESYGISQMTKSQEKQAMVPEGALVITNPAGLAPGIIMAQGNKAIIMLPGPPKEMKALFAECSRLYINRLSDHVFVSINIKVKGPDEMPLSVIGEAPIADQLGDILDNENPTVATYAKEDGVLIRVTASGKTREDALVLMKPVVTKIAEILADKIAWVKEDA